MVHRTGVTRNLAYNRFGQKRKWLGIGLIVEYFVVRRNKIASARSNQAKSRRNLKDVGVM